MHVIQIETDPLRHAIGSEAANRDVGVAICPHGEIQIGHRQTNLIEPLDIPPFNFECPNCRDGLGYVHQILIALSGGDDDFLQRGSLREGLRCSVKRDAQ